MDDGEAAPHRARQAPGSPHRAQRLVDRRENDVHVAQTNARLLGWTRGEPGPFVGLRNELDDLRHGHFPDTLSLGGGTFGSHKASLRILHSAPVSYTHLTLPTNREV